VADQKILKMEWLKTIYQLDLASFITIKCAQRNICILHGKSGFFGKKWAI